MSVWLELFIIYGLEECPRFIKLRCAPECVCVCVRAPPSLIGNRPPESVCLQQSEEVEVCLPESMVHMNRPGFFRGFSGLRGKYGTLGPVVSRKRSGQARRFRSWLSGSHTGLTFQDGFGVGERKDWWRNGRVCRTKRMCTGSPPPPHECSDRYRTPGPDVTLFRNDPVSFTPLTLLFTPFKKLNKTKPRSPFFMVLTKFLRNLQNWAELSVVAEYGAPCWKIFELKETAGKKRTKNMSTLRF